MGSLTLTVVIPAHNEEDGLGDTIASLHAQSVQAQRIIVIDDGSTDRTAQVAQSWGVEVISTPQATGSKAGAQNYALQFIDTDLVLPVDADTTLDPDYIAKIKAPFVDPNVTIASGCVLTKTQDTLWERARQLEYLVGFHYYRSIQQMVGAITVCSGCCTTFRVNDLVESGGHPFRTLVEDIDYTWTQQIAGKRAFYVHDAIARAAEPDSLKFMATQLKRWKSGYFQNVRLHWRELVSKKKLLALWVSMQLVEMLLAPAALILPVFWINGGLAWWKVPLLWVAGDFLTFWPIVLWGCHKRGYSMGKALRSYPDWMVLKALNLYYDMTRAVNELILAPLGWRSSFTVYEKGH